MANRFGAGVDQTAAEPGAYGLDGRRGRRPHFLESPTHGAESLRAGKLRVGQSMQIDALLAAAAQVHELTLVTRNSTDFESAVDAILNPWS